LEDEMYDVIYADPPWPYANARTGGSLTSGAGQQYTVMGISDIMRVPVAPACRDTALCFMWATCPLLPEALATLEAWGFRYKAEIIWHKTGRLGMGFWSRVQAEHLLIGVKGHVPPPRLQIRNVVEAPTEGHSVKPEVFRGIVEAMADKSLPGWRGLELFARRRAPRWDAAGYDVGVDVIDALRAASGQGDMFGGAHV